MLKQYIRQIVASNPEYAGIIPVIEKEILHHDIMDVMIKQGVMQSLTFIGGTSLMWTPPCQCELFGLIQFRKNLDLIQNYFEFSHSVS